MAINSALSLVYNQLTAFAGLDDFWDRFDTAFGTQYDYFRSYALSKTGKCANRRSREEFVYDGQE